MKIDNDVFSHKQMPLFIEEAEVLSKYLKRLTYDQLKTIWNTSDNIAKNNFDIIKKMDLYENLTPAILGYEGLQYQYIRPEVFTYNELDYIEDHLRILSGFYGVLKPFDGIVRYRLEMQSKILLGDYESLYDYWAEKIAKSIFKESKCIVNLASKEYSKCISKYLTKEIKLINCVFGEIIGGKVIEKGTLAKMARGEMVRFMAENNICKVEEIKKFNRLDYTYKEDLSDNNNFIFIKEKPLPSTL